MDRSIDRCMHAYLPTYLPTYLHTYISTYLHTYIPAYVRMYVPTYVHACMHIYIYVLQIQIEASCIHIKLYTCTQFCTQHACSLSTRPSVLYAQYVRAHVMPRVWGKFHLRRRVQRSRWASASDFWARWVEGWCRRWFATYAISVVVDVDVDVTKASGS